MEQRNQWRPIHSILETVLDFSPVEASPKEHKADRALILRRYVYPEL